MSRMKTISWMLLVIIVIGIVAILTRTPVRSDGGSAAEAASAVTDTLEMTDTIPDDSAETEQAGEPQNSSQ